MHGSFVLLLLLLSALLSVVTGQSPCPDPSSISPCVCSYNDFFDTVSVDCSLATSSEDLFAAFNDAVWPITELLDFRLTGNGYVQDLPSGVFGNVSFQSMFIHFTVVSSVHPEALSSSKDRLGELRIFDGSLQEFPWDALPAFTRLETLNLYRNELASVPAVESPSLRSLYLSGNRIAALEGPWSIPNLIFLELDGNPVSELPQGLFQGFENLFSFACSSCNLGPILKTGSMEFRSQDLGSVYLDGNGISSLEPYAITVHDRGVVDFDRMELPVLVVGCV
ncbi:unnamed protein product [Darwinula stevensoni]|uniref:Uncharacterized protein n=1 Tax=Darwinula stevensoni TaxID=69355 RepID=A0A7R9FT14_9CRUS|nr:unnamed protein product [Darwinula stevensoni]CAG0903702.1 unnamed protein product [Darwinula stevensoni]